MSDTEFMTDPLAFMRSNLVIIPAGFTGDMTPGIKLFTLRAYPNLLGRRLGQVVPIYGLMPSQSISGIRAYWCPYKQNELHSVTVGHMARFMFTATMDGCSLGIGSKAGSSRMVSHVNSGSYGASLERALGMDKARVEQRKLQNALLRHKHGSGVSVVSPLNYMSDVDGALVLKSTTFGLRPDGVDDWEFYSQRYYKDTGRREVVYFLRDVKRLF